VNMAVLGMCPANGTFAGSISYIYMNEISTVAAAYAMAGYGTDAFHIGVNAQGPENGDRPAYVLNALKQAMLNAGLLYDSQGSSTSTTYAGEGHIARSVTPEGNGTVPQASLDTIGNILAACVDSNNAYGTTATGGTESTQRKFLFQTATSDGIPVSSNGSTTATDIAGAAFNMAHHPAGGNSSVSASYMNTLFTLPAGNVPFAPNLITQPNDFAVQLAFTVPASQGSAGSDNHGGWRELCGCARWLDAFGGDLCGKLLQETGEAVLQWNAGLHDQHCAGGPGRKCSGYDS
jgi:hypothetical protein